MPLLEIEAGYAGLQQKLLWMKKLIYKGVVDERVMKTTYSLVKNLPPRDKFKEAEAILKYIKKNVRYLNDPVNIELIKSSPRLLFEYRQGDCDCASVLLATMLHIVGIPTKFVAVKTYLDKEPRHVYVAAKLYDFDDKYYALDPTVDKPIGWESTSIVEKTFIDNVSGEIETEEVKGASMAQLGEQLYVLEGLDSFIRKRNANGLSQAELEGLWDTAKNLITQLLLMFKGERTPAWYSKIADTVKQINAILEQLPEAEKKMKDLLEKSQKTDAELWISNPLTWASLGVAGVLLIALISKK